MQALYRLVGFDPTKYKLRTELLAGLTTFLTMSYILAVNPDILSTAGMDKGAVFTATALASAVGTLLIAFLAKLPFAQAPSMGINAFFAFTLVMGMGYSWQAGLAAVFVEGVIFILLTAFGEEGLSAATNLLHLVWWPATLIRLLVYLGISWLLLPRLNRYIREQALQRIAAQREASLADGVLDHDRLQQLDAAEAHIHQAGITPKLLFGLLLGFDLLALQLPYLLH